MLLSALMEENVRNKLIPALGQIAYMNPDRKEDYDEHLEEDRINQENLGTQ